ncbi:MULTISPECIES: hypothetical protein [unclassified Bradyrhizobium]|uniref:hypothetical protein n=1 Tax=unclassified Bradyrhizobium TaxID=2631580 RepID=UPI0033908FCF
MLLSGMSCVIASWAKPIFFAVVNLLSSFRTIGEWRWITLLGSKIDQIVQHARAQSDLTYRDQMLVIEGQPEGVPAVCFPVLLAGPAHGLYPVFFDASKK